MNRTLTALFVTLAVITGCSTRADTESPTAASPSVASAPTPTPTAEPFVAAPSPSAWTGLPAGPHMILDGHADDPADNFPPLTVTIPAPGWNAFMSGVLEKNEDVAPDGLGMIIFVGREYTVYGDACNWETTVPETPVTTVDELVAALSSQGSRDASGPVDITLGGYAGKSITLEVPADVDFTKCDPGHSGSWSCGG